MSQQPVTHQPLRAVILRPGESGWTSFLALPGQMGFYPDSQIPLRNQLNKEFLTGGILITTEQNLVGRVALYQNPSLWFQGQSTGILGNYECIDSPEVASFLLETAEKELRKAGNHYLIGPMNGSTWDQYRFTVHPEIEPFFTEQIQPAYYLTQWEKYGFRGIGEYSSALDLELVVDARVDRGLDLIKRKGISIRPISLDRYEEELDRLYDLCLEGFSGNYLYSPISKDSFLSKYLPAKGAIDPKWVLIAEDENGVPGAFIFCLPDYWHQQSRRLIIKTLVRHPDRKWAGIGSVLSGVVISEAKKDGIDAMIHALMFQGGGGKSVSSRFNGETLQTYRLYGKNC